MNGGAKIIFAATIGALVAGGGAWFTLAGDVVTEAQAIDLIEVHSPYVEDRKIMLQGLEEVKGMRDDMRRMRQDMTALVVLMMDKAKKDAE